MIYSQTTLYALNLNRIRAYSKFYSVYPKFYFSSNTCLLSEIIGILNLTKMIREMTVHYREKQTGIWERKTLHAKAFSVAATVEKI